jgi:hypothetical protein
VGRLSITKSWPAIDRWVGFHMGGTRHMPARDPSGIRPSARGRILRAASRFVLKGER